MTLALYTLTVEVPLQHCLVEGNSTFVLDLLRHVAVLGKPL